MIGHRVDLDRIDRLADMMGMGAPVSVSAQDLRILVRAARLVLNLDEQWADFYPCYGEAEKVVGLLKGEQ